MFNLDQEKSIKNLNTCFSDSEKLTIFQTVDFVKKLWAVKVRATIGGKYFKYNI
jgi:hypothetical protein